MKQIILMCHAITNELKEFEPHKTPLINEQGINQINSIKNSARNILKETEFIQCSDSKPCRQTFQSLYQCFDKNVKFMFDSSMETSSGVIFIEKLQWTPSVYEKIMFIGNKNYFEQILKKITSFNIERQMLYSEIIVFQSKQKSWQKVNGENIEIVTNIIPSSVVEVINA